MKLKKWKAIQKIISIVIIMVMVFANPVFLTKKVYAATTVTFSGTIADTGTNSFDRPDIYTLGGSDTTPVLSNFAGCTTSGSNFNYFTRSIIPDTTGSYTIQVTSANLTPGTVEGSGGVASGYGYGSTNSPISAYDDTTMYIYDSGFNPNSPLSGLLWANDDTAFDTYGNAYSNSSNYKSTIPNMTLTAGHTYVLVVTSFLTGVTGNIGFGITGPGNVIVSRNSYSTLEPGKTLTAATTDNDVDHNIDVTFETDATFEGSIIGVSFNGTLLTVNTDYVVSSGKVTLKPSGGNIALRTPAIGNVVITAAGYNNSTVSQTINPAPVVPSITSQSGNQTVTAGNAVSFSVTATGDATLSYQWKKNDVNIPGAIGATYTISSTQASDAGSYTVVVTNGAGSVTSNAATLTVNPAPVAPTITVISPTSGSTAGGTSVIITGTNLTGATGVKFGSSNATSFTVNSATQITAVSPAGSAGALDVTVTTVGGTSATSGVDQFTYVAAPTATTMATTSITASGATLNGTVSANGASTAVTFEYGITTQYGSTAAASQGSVTGSSLSVSANLSGLAPGTMYHYRVKGENSAGTTYGSDSTFTTIPAAPSVSNNSPTSLTTSVVILNGTVNANGASTDVTFRYGTTTSYGSTITATPSTVTGSTDTGVSAAISGLTPGTTYHYQVRSVNAGGTTYGADDTFTTGTAAPSVSNDSPTSLTTSGVTLNGTVNANGADTTVTFEYGTTTSYENTASAIQGTVTAGSGSTAISAAISGLTPGTTYHYRVKSVNAGGTTYGSDLTFKTGTAAPSVSNDSPTSLTTSGVTLNGTVNANGLSTTVTIDYGTTTSYGTPATVVGSPVTGGNNTAVSAVLTGLSPNTTYHYKIVGVNSTGSTDGGDATFTTNALAPVASSITSHPSSKTVTVGNAVSFSVSATGDATLSYQWKKNDVNIDGEIGATYTISSTKASDAGSYTVVVTNGAGSVTSAAATLTVNAAESTEVILTTDSLGKADDSKVTGLTEGLKYQVGIGGTLKYVKGNGTLSTSKLDLGDLIGTEIIGLTNGETYNVQEYTTSAAVTVVLDSGSLGTAGDECITGLTAGNKYKVIVNGVTEYVKLDGTLSTIELEAGSLSGTEIVGLTNGITYKVEEYTASSSSGKKHHSSTGGSGGSLATDKITVNITDGSSDKKVSQTEIERTTSSDGNKTDTVNYTADKAKETIEALSSQAKDVARIVATDSDTQVTETKVNISKDTLSVLSSANINLEIETNGAIVSVPKESVQGLVESGQLNEDLYFRVVPINDEVKQKEIKITASKEAEIKAASGNNEIQVLGTPMTIQTNMSKGNVDIILPLTGVTLPADASEREAFFNDLGVFVEHSDGEKVFQRGTVVEYKPGFFGIKFTVTKFSDFTIVKLNNKTANSIKAGWKFADGYWCFIEKDGNMAKGWHKADRGEWTYDKKDTVDAWFHLDPNGKMNTGWFKDTDGSWYYLCDGSNYGALGVMETGWIYIDGKWYFLKDNGVMTTNWQEINGVWYYFNSNGSMASDTAIDGYTLNSSGALIK